MKKVKGRLLGIAMGLVMVSNALITIPNTGNMVPDKVYAKAPSVDDYATAAQLMDPSMFSLSGDSESAIGQKIYFGGSDNNVPWVIAGTDNVVGGKNLVILNCSNSFGNSMDFENDLYNHDNDYDYYYNGDSNKDKRLAHNYSGTTAEVYLNHYGASDLRALFVSLESNINYFSQTQMGLLIPVSVTTADVCNDNNYTTTDVFYAPGVANYSADNSKDFNLGTNDQIVVNIAKMKESTGWTRSFFTRTAAKGYNSGKGIYGILPVFEKVYGDIILWDRSNSYYPLPATTLDVSSLLFAATPARRTSGKGASASVIESGTPMTLRHYGKSRFGSSFGYTNDTITVKKGEDKNQVYLFVQGQTDDDKDWVYSIPVTEDMTVTSSNVMEKLNSVNESVLSSAPSFTDCKLWLETTDDDTRLTYAIWTEGAVYPEGIKEPDSKTGENPSDDDKPGEEQKPSTVDVSSVTLSKTSLLMTVGESLSLGSSVKPDNATDKGITWSTSNKAVATVDSSGKVTAVAVGSATITAKAGGQIATCDVMVKEKFPAVGTTETDNSGKATYKVSETSKDSSGNTVVEVTYVAPTATEKKKATSVTVPDTVTLADGTKAKVTSVASGAFKKNTKIKKVTIGSNVKTVGANAFSGNKKLKTIVINSKKLKSVGKNAFKNINKKATIKVPKKQLKAYKKLFKKAGLPKSVKIKKK